MFEAVVSLSGNVREKLVSTANDTLESAGKALEATVPVKRKVRWIEVKGLKTDLGVVGGDYANMGADYQLSADCDYDVFGNPFKKSLKRRVWEKAINMAKIINGPTALKFAVGGTCIYFATSYVNSELNNFPDIPGVIRNAANVCTSSAAFFTSYKASDYIQGGIGAVADEARRRLYLS